MVNAHATSSAQTVKDEWWQPKIDRSVLKGLMQRSDGPGLYFLAIWGLLLSVTGYAIYLSQGSWLIVPAVVAYGIVLGFAYAPSHECAHGTAFRTRWLNETVFWLSSFIWVESPTHRRFAHSHHHTYTWHWKVDAQMAYTNPIKMMTWFGDIIGLLEFWPRAKLTLRHASGRVLESERVYLPDNQIPTMVREARILLTGYLLLLSWALIGQTWIPMLYFFIPRFTGAIGVYSFITTQHMAMQQDVYDHRLSTRSMTNGWLGRMLYWNMNYHIEHHVFPSIPFHALPALNAAIKDQLPEPSPSLLAAHIEIIQTIFAQRRNPNAHAYHPLPSGGEGASTSIATN